MPAKTPHCSTISIACVLGRFARILWERLHRHRHPYGRSPKSVDLLTRVSYFLHMKVEQEQESLGDILLSQLAALANPHRLAIVASLKINGRAYISQLAREIGISRPLLHLHLKKLEDAGLVTSRLELSNDGKALNYFEVTAFDLHLSPSTIAEAKASLTINPKNSET